MAITYEEFEPLAETKQEKDCEILILTLPGFTKDQLRVQLTTSRTLRIGGECQLENYKYRRFQKEFPVSPNCDTHRITASFEANKLKVKQPKIITPAEQEDRGKQAPEAVKTQEPKKESPPKRDAKETAAQQVTSSTPSLDKQPSGKAAAETAEKEMKPSAKNVKAVKAETTEKEKEPIATKAEISTILTDSNNVTQKKLDEKSGISTDLNNVTGKKLDEKSGTSATNSTGNASKVDRGAFGLVTSDYKALLNKYTKVASGQLIELKKPENLIKLGVVVLAVVFGFYVTNSTRFNKGPKQN